VPEDAIANALLEELGQPLIGTTLITPDNELLNDPEEIRARFARQVDLIIDGGACAMEPTTVIDLTAAEALLVRRGRGDQAMFGL
jgi:tRNA A37 threonylcarbamoyladenosine synthetase subunit TsaC/SUA5/YrdC